MLMRAAMLGLVALGGTAWGQSASTGAIRFYGTGTGGQDRVRIPVDDNVSGQVGNRPADVGGVGFTVDFWIRGQASDNTSAPRAEGSYDDVGWIEGNIVVDRDIWGTGSHSDRDWGVSLAGGYVAFGTGNGQGPVGQQSLLVGGNATDALNTIYGNIPVLSGAWHHVAVVRDHVTGSKRIYVDGVLDYEAVGVSNDDLSYPDAGTTGDPSSQDNNAIVLGAEKHDAGAAYPSFSGFLDEVRVWRRALSGEEIAFLRDKVVPGHHPGLAGYWRFEETGGTTINDSATVGPVTPSAPSDSPGTLVNNTAGNGLRVFASANASHTAPVSLLPVPSVAFGSVRVATSGSFNRPIFATHAPGQPDRLYVVEQGNAGTAAIRIFSLTSNSVMATPFLTLTGLGSANEEGLLGLAFHPDYAINGALYVYVTNGSTGNNEIRRYLRSAGNPDTADPASAMVILTIPHPGQTNHNGGWMGFGPDGFLYVATGDGGGGNDPSNNAQNRDSLLGKILRISPGIAGNATYTIPSGNPFVGVAGADEVWAFGLRNPWRCSFDRATGDLWIGDVGQSGFEEINRLPAGVAGWNFGWPAVEGFADNLGRTDQHPVAATPPVADLGRTLAASITGGYVYRGGAITGLQGTYFYADFVRSINGNARVFSFRLEGGIVREAAERSATLDPSPSGATPGILFVASFGEDAYGELYLLDRTDGEMFKVVPLSAWDLWRAARFTAAELADPTVSGDNGDPDGDFNTNLFEYVADTNPQIPNVPPVVAGTMVVTGQTHATLTLNKAAVSGVTIEGQGSADMGLADPWSASNVVVVSNTPGQIVIRSSAPVPSQGGSFLRFRITRP
jgi:hypothetical protein